ncbi:MAG TPA: FAD/NAD(P)-binding protein [Acidimicrobiales bacterium]|nr:FAD/NAD(P)-binding protein [Acidimicrobiales bacterium]
MTPVLYRVLSRRRHTVDVVTLRMAPLRGEAMTLRCGQFNMLTAFGVGESAISVSSGPDERDWIEHTVRDVGPVTHALCATAPGEVVGVRGPFGTDWGVEEEDGDVVVVAGGIGLAPLRGAILHLLGRSGDGRLFVLVGARSPSQFVFAEDLRAWSAAGAHVAVTVDVAEPGWAGHVGLVTSLLGTAGFDPAATSALVCGPEVMMRFVAGALLDRGMAPHRIKVSLERNMQCGLAWCGHCQLGPLLLCRDGPVVTYDGVVPPLMLERER